MKKETFKELLTDLYSIYNPSYLIYVDELVEKNSRMEADAVKTIFIKYNHKSKSYYDPEIGTDDYVIKLIGDYNSGRRTLQGIKLSESPKIIQEDKSEQKTEEIKNELHKIITDDLEKTSKDFSNREQEFDKVINEKLRQMEDAVSAKIKLIEASFEDVDIIILAKHTETILELPNKKNIASLSIGSRIITRDSEGKVIGLVIEDILYDSTPLFYEIPGKPKIEITVNKA